MDVVINVCFGGFRLSEAAYKKLIEWGVPVRAYTPQVRGEDGLYKPQPANDGEVIFDRTLETESRFNKFLGRYWDTWIEKNRAHPLLVRVVRELGARAYGECSHLKIVTIPDGTEYTICEYDGNEHIAEKRRTWS